MYIVSKIFSQKLLIIKGKLQGSSCTSPLSQTGGDKGVIW